MTGILDLNYMEGDSNATIDPWIKSIVWFVSAEGNWNLAEVKDRNKIDNGESVFTLDYNGVEHKVRTTALDAYDFEFQLVKRHDRNPDFASQTVDMTTLTCLNEPEMVECLRCRYLNDEIYTRVGPILIAINPCKTLNIYSDNKYKLYSNDGFVKTNSSKLPPHIFQIGNSAYHNMFIDKLDPNKREDQVIIVHGESGAGKTSSVKFILDFLASLSTRKAEMLQISSSEGLRTGNQVVASNPIIESFGNAKTLRNNNSSRFGKFIELCYNENGLIAGGIIRSYLLETVRVTRQAKGERNFHIFYEVCTDENIKNRYKTMGINNILKHFRYTNQSGEYYRHDNETDTANFIQLRKAMLICNINKEIQEHIFNVILAVLHLSSIKLITVEVVGGENVDFSTESCQDIEQICSLLGITSRSLLHSISKRIITIRGVDIEKKLNKMAVSHSVDYFAQIIYHLLFLWIINKINKNLIIEDGHEHELQHQLQHTQQQHNHMATSQKYSSYIGILDIFGFEYFENNSFEQLCINYTNEKLQDHFNFTIFRTEQDIYSHEGLHWTLVDYPDNSARLELLEHKVLGIFALCDEQLKIPNATDEKYAKSLYEKHKNNLYFNANKNEQKNLEFIIKHFARDVCYQINGFLDKNRGNVAKEYFDCLHSSSIDLIQECSSIDLLHIETIDVANPTDNKIINKSNKRFSMQYVSPLRQVTDRQVSVNGVTDRLINSEKIHIHHYNSPSKHTSNNSNNGNSSNSNNVSNINSNNHLVEGLPSTNGVHSNTNCTNNTNNNNNSNNSNTTTTTSTTITSTTATSAGSNSKSYSRVISRIESTPNFASSQVHTRKHKSISSVFIQQLQELSNKIECTKPHFIRCIKPNNLLICNSFQQQIVVHQLRCGGTLAAIQVFRAGFSTRIPMIDFLIRFMCMKFICGKNIYIIKELEYIINGNNKNNENHSYSSSHLLKIGVIMLFKFLSIPISIINQIESINLSTNMDFETGLMIGKTRVFLRPHLYEYLESIRFYTGCVAARVIQSYWRNYSLVSRGLLKKKRHGILNCSRSFVLYKHTLLVKQQRASIIIQRRARMFSCQCHLHRAIQSVIRIQSLYRAVGIRREWRRIIRGTTLIQSVIRGRIIRLKYCHTLSMIILIQAKCKRWVDAIRQRREVRRREILLKQIPIIQALFRGYRVRENFRKIFGPVRTECHPLSMQRLHDPMYVGIINKHIVMVTIKMEMYSRLKQHISRQSMTSSISSISTTSNALFNSKDTHYASTPDSEYLSPSHCVSKYTYGEENEYEQSPEENQLELLNMLKLSKDLKYNKSSPHNDESNNSCIKDLSSLMDDVNEIENNNNNSYVNDHNNNDQDHDGDGNHHCNENHITNKKTTNVALVQNGYGCGCTGGSTHRSENGGCLTSIWKMFTRR